MDRAAPFLDLWLTYCDEISDAALLHQYRGLMSTEERMHESRLRMASDRHRYVVTRALLRTVLSRYAAVAPREWEFVVSAEGRPRISRRHRQTLGLDFNISHSHGLVLVGITRHAALGVDAENHCARPISLEIAQRYYCAEEFEDVARQSAHAQQRRFFEYWTLKEAYVKALGLGLALPFNQFGFSFSRSGSIDMKTHAALAGSAPSWQFLQFLPQPEYIVAACLQRCSLECNEDKPVPVSAHQVVPLLSEQPLFLNISRASTSAWACPPPVQMPSQSHHLPLEAHDSVVRGESSNTALFA